MRFIKTAASKGCELPWCPNCKKEREIGVEMYVIGVLAEDRTISDYPIVEQEAAELDCIASCMVCEYEGSLYEFEKLEGE